MTCFYFSLYTTYREWISSAKCTPKYNPRPVTLDIHGESFKSSYFKNDPISRLFSTRLCFYTYDKTAAATKHAAEFPPKVLKYVLGKKRSSYSLKIHAPIG